MCAVRAICQTAQLLLARYETMQAGMAQLVALTGDLGRVENPVGAR
jgi:hypothetical protein